MRATEDDYIGRTIARKYRVEALIGEGGMGKVFRARQLTLDKVVVLKVLRQSLLGDERTVARFQREAKAASRLNHPNSISVLDFGQTEEGALFIAMEYVSGQDLHQLLSREWPLPEGRVVRLVGQVLSALSDAHGAGVIHRDLKPENIMVEQRRGEQPDFVKVLDFGIAKITDSAGEEGPALTRAGFVCGTPEYMSPEQARGATLDHRSDLYAVGVILYQLMTGLLPFESDSAVGFATKHLTEEPPPPTRRRPEAKISPGMERLILRALSKDPNDRPATAEAFRAELLEVDKERRAGNAARKTKSKTSPVLAPLPRRATPGDQIDTNPSTAPAWGPPSAAESTVRAVPEEMMTAQNPVPQAREREPQRTDEQVPRVQLPAEGFNFLKALTILMVLAAMAFGGYYYYAHLRDQPPETPFVPPPNAPVPGQTGSLEAPGGEGQLYARRFATKDASASVTAETDGDRLQEQGSLPAAINAYRKAFQNDPRPELALKLAAVLSVSNPQEARGWMTRFLEDRRDSAVQGELHARLEHLADASAR